MSWIAWAVTGAVVVLLLLWGVAIYNRLVRQRALVKEGFSGITVQLRRRADLIPNLVSTVEGYATHERETLSQVIAHRGDAVNAKGDFAGVSLYEFAEHGSRTQFAICTDDGPRTLPAEPLLAGRPGD